MAQQPVLDETLLQANKLSILETIFPSIAHEINNALALLKMEVGEAEILQQKIDSIAHAVSHVHDYLKPKNEPLVLEINDLIEKSIAIHQMLFKNKLIFVKSLSKTINQKTYFYLLQQVVSNLFMVIFEEIKNDSEARKLKLITDKSVERFTLYIDLNKTLSNVTLHQAFHFSHEIMAKHLGDLKIVPSRAYHTCFILAWPVA